jgi:hypothetical protein
MIVFSEDTDEDVAATPFTEYNDAPPVPAVGDEVKMFGTQIDGKVIKRCFVYNPDEVKIVLTIASH